MSKTYRLWQFMDVEVEDENELQDKAHLLRFVHCCGENGLGVEFLGEDVKPYWVSFAPNASNLTGRATSCRYLVNRIAELSKFAEAVRTTFEDVKPYTVPFAAVVNEREVSTNE